MNAKQIADELENIYWIQGDGKGKPFQQYADFVRQQQAEYYSLLVNHDKLYAKVVEQQAEIEALKQSKSDANNKVNNEPVAWRSKDTDGYWSIYQAPVEGAEPLYTHPADLTDEEIIEIWSGMETDTGEQNIAFARAILKKAGEK